MWSVATFFAHWGWWIGAGLMLGSAIQQSIDGDHESTSLRIFIVVAWVLIATRERELRHVREQLTNTREQRDRAFQRIRTLDPRSKR